MLRKSPVVKYITLVGIIFLMAAMIALLKRALGLPGGFEVYLVSGILALVLTPATMTQTVSAPCTDRQAALDQIFAATKGRGWRLKETTEQGAVYKPAAFISTLMDDLYVDFSTPGTVTMTGPQPIVSSLPAKLK